MRHNNSTKATQFTTFNQVQALCLNLHIPSTPETRSRAKRALAIYDSGRLRVKRRYKASGQQYFDVGSQRKVDKAYTVLRTQHGEYHCPCPDSHHLCKHSIACRILDAMVDDSFFLMRCLADFDQPLPTDDPDADFDHFMAMDQANWKLSRAQEVTS